ncbi:hypothetical protein PsorP6_008983 [Peronosclerospora sorghi]|uniref:Uncharacterized protein n=1 Tax=Peronosclerospora sorghi TaxID=230839 RepID=A0ACC0VZX1_9STRA|nr:hypothetical protein PsorP6_008983 [Peronosclerospora sorghi]
MSILYGPPTSVPVDDLDVIVKHSLQIATVDGESLYPSAVVFHHGTPSVPDVTELAWITRALTAHIEIIGHQPQFMRKTMGAWIGMEEEDGEQGKVELSCETFGWKYELGIRNSTVLTMQDVERLRKVMQRKEHVLQSMGRLIRIQSRTRHRKRSLKSTSRWTARIYRTAKKGARLCNKFHSPRLGRRTSGR